MTPRYLPTSLRRRSGEAPHQAPVTGRRVAAKHADLGRAALIASAVAMAEHAYPTPAVKAVDGEWYAEQIRKRKSYLRMLAIRMGLDPDETEKSMTLDFAHVLAARWAEGR